MSTKRQWTCSKGCARDAGSLFDALHAIAEGSVAPCPKHNADQTLTLEFQFALGVSDTQAKVLDAFLPDEPESWPGPDGSDVTFYPFIVIVERNNRDKAFWLPYWHLIRDSRRKSVKKKYGQWAPFMDNHLFHSLLRQARDKGYLDDSSSVI